MTSKRNDDSGSCSVDGLADENWHRSVVNLWLIRCAYQGQDERWVIMEPVRGRRVLLVWDSVLVLGALKMTDLNLPNLKFDGLAMRVSIARFC